MHFIDVLIPLIAGLLAIFMPKLLIKKDLPAEEFAKKSKVLKKIGYVLVGVATLYLFISLASSRQ